MYILLLFFFCKLVRFIYRTIFHTILKTRNIPNFCAYLAQRNSFSFSGMEEKSVHKAYLCANTINEERLDRITWEGGRWGECCINNGGKGFFHIKIYRGIKYAP